jgi:hypothetical protein
MHELKHDDPLAIAFDKAVGGSHAVKKAPARGGVKSISDIWSEANKAAEMVEAIDDADPRKSEARASIGQTTEKLLAYQFRVLNEARRKKV